MNKGFYTMLEVDFKTNKQDRYADKSLVEPKQIFSSEQLNIFKMQIFAISSNILMKLNEKPVFQHSFYKLDVDKFKAEFRYRQDYDEYHYKRNDRGQIISIPKRLNQLKTHV